MTTDDFSAAEAACPPADFCSETLLLTPQVLRQQRKAEERKEQAKKAAEWRESSIARHKEQASKSGSRKRCSFLPLMRIP